MYTLEIGQFQLHTVKMANSYIFWEQSQLYTFHSRRSLAHKQSATIKPHLAAPRQLCMV